MSITVMAGFCRFLDGYRLYNLILRSLAITHGSITNNTRADHSPTSHRAIIGTCSLLFRFQRQRSIHAESVSQKLSTRVRCINMANARFVATLSEMFDVALPEPACSIFCTWNNQAKDWVLNDLDESGRHCSINIDPSFAAI